MILRGAESCSQLASNTGCCRVNDRLAVFQSCRVCVGVKCCRCEVSERALGCFALGVRLPSTDVRPLVQERVSDEGVCYELCRPPPGMRSWLPTCLRGLYMVSSAYLASRVALPTLISTYHTAHTTGQHIPHTQA
eukprot:3212625-Rhodomonas_salina.2